MARTASPARAIAYPQRSDPRPPIVHVGNTDFGLIEDLFSLISIDQDTIIVLPTSYESGFDRISDDEWSEGTLAWKARKTCVVYEDVFKTSSPHPRLAEYLGRDPWTALPLLKKPSGPPLEGLMMHHHELMYTNPRVSASALSCRPRPEYLPLVYQWCLQLLSALEFVHSHNIIFGHFDRSNIWLSSSLCISLVGFTAASWPLYPSKIISNYPFKPTFRINRKYIKTSIKTDLFCYGNTIYEMMTSFWPGEGKGLTMGERKDMYVRGEFPVLEHQYLGEIVDKCWHYKYDNIQQLKEDISRFFNGTRWEVNDDMLKGFDAMELFNGHMRDSYPGRIDKDDK